MILHEAADYQKNCGNGFSAGKDFPEEMLALMPVDSFEAMPGTDGNLSPLPFFILSDDDEDNGDDEDNFDDMEEEDFDDDDDDFEDDDFDDDDDDEYDDDEYDDDYSDEDEYDGFDE
jgi:hypothetical protein